MTSLVLTPSPSKDNPLAPDVLLRAASIRRNRLKGSTIRGVRVDVDSRAHSPDLHSRSTPESSIPVFRQILSN